MKIADVMGHLTIPMSEEENAIVEKFSDDTLRGEDLNERELVVANKMVSRGLLKRNSNHNETVFYKNSYGDTNVGT